MPQEPKKRHSRQRQGKRRASIHLKTQKSVVCPNCAGIIIPHTVCKYCGYYDKRQVLTMKKKQEKEKMGK
ncbi:MAG: 50S ribosomal protein L32 [Candidatus Levybacteria bacterium]|nr:50S ribosomal protein L32 [Candidatus Levybacteria bacterium]